MTISMHNSLSPVGLTGRIWLYIDAYKGSLGRPRHAPTTPRLCFSPETNPLTSNHARVQPPASRPQRCPRRRRRRPRRPLLLAQAAATPGPDGRAAPDDGEQRVDPVQGAREAWGVRDDAGRALVLGVRRHGAGRAYVLLFLRGETGSGQCAGYCLVEWRAGE